MHTAWLILLIQKKMNNTFKKIVAICIVIAFAGCKTPSVIQRNENKEVPDSFVSSETITFGRKLLIVERFLAKYNLFFLSLRFPIKGFKVLAYKLLVLKNIDDSSRFVFHNNLEIMSMELFLNLNFVL